MRILTLGGGTVGTWIADLLCRYRHSVTVVDNDPTHTKRIDEELDVRAITGSASQSSVRFQAGAMSADLCLAVTGDDENNIMAGVEAREIGARKIMAIVGRPDYASVVNKLGIDVAVSERDVMAKQVFGFLNTGNVISHTALPGGNIGVYEIEIMSGCAATEHVLANLRLPSPCLITAVLREGYVRVPGADDRLLAGDTVVALIDDAAVDAALQFFRASGR